MKQISFIILLLIATNCYAQTTDATSFQASPEWNKLDSRTQNAWLDAVKNNDKDRRIDCFVRVRAPADRGDESFLLDHGYVVRFFSGNVATGHMKVGDLPDVAKLSFVDSIKLSGK